MVHHIPHHPHVHHARTQSSGQSDETARSHHEKRKEIRRRLKHKHHSKIPFHVKWTQFMHTDTKNHIVAMVGEFIGTFLFLFFAFAGVGVANLERPPDGGSVSIIKLQFIAVSFGLSLMVNAWIFYRISGGLFNPAVTLAVVLLKAITPFRGVLLFIAQITAACFSSYIVQQLFPTPFAVNTSLLPGTPTTRGTSITQGLFIEAMGTAELVFTIIMLAKEKHRATFIAPVGIGLALFIGELVSVQYTGGALNPARAFGPAAVSRSLTKDHWIYWIGPLIGSLLAVVFFKLFKIMEYEMVNPGQDGDIENDPTQNPDHELARVNSERAAEVEELHAIEDAGGFEKLNEQSRDPSIKMNEGDNQGQIEDNGGIGRGREMDTDLEAQWDEDIAHGDQRGGVRATRDLDFDPSNQDGAGERRWVTIRK